MYCLFSDQIAAVKDLWFIGDVFLKDVFYTFRAMKQSSHRKPAAECDPYLHQIYNVKHYESSGNFRMESAMTRILNSLIRVLNENQSLPRLIVVMMDHEFLTMLKHTTFGVSIMIGKCLHWLMSDMGIMVQRKKHAMAFYKPGVLTPLEPKFIWVKMLERPNPSKEMGMMKAKFNVILEQVLSQVGSGFILDPVPDQGIPRAWFDFNGNMTHDGRIGYW